MKNESDKTNKKSCMCPFCDEKIELPICKLCNKEFIRCSKCGCLLEKHITVCARCGTKI